MNRTARAAQELAQVLTSTTKSLTSSSGRADLEPVPTHKPRTRARAVSSDPSRLGATAQVGANLDSAELTQRVDSPESALLSELGSVQTQCSCTLYLLGAILSSFQARIELLKAPDSWRVVLCVYNLHIKVRASVASQVIIEVFAQLFLSLN